MRKIFLSVNTQFENLGDALINRELIKLLSLNGDIVVDTASAPKWFIDMLELPLHSCIVKGKGKLLKKLLTARLAGEDVYYFYMPGGSFGELSFSQFLKKSIVSSIFFLFSALGIKFCSVGISYERLGSKFLSYLRFRNLHMHRFYVRDRDTSELLKMNGVKHDGVLPDLAFSLFSEPATKSNEIKRVCFSFRTDQYSEQFAKCYSFAERVISCLPRSTQLHIAVQVRRDLEGMQAMASLLQERLGVIAEVKCETGDIESMRQFYKNMDLIISNRLHVLLLGGSVSGRLLAYADEKNRKISGLFSTIGRSDLLLNDKSTETDIRGAIESSFFDGQGLCSELKFGVGSIFR